MHYFVNYHKKLLTPKMQEAYHNLLMGLEDVADAIYLADNLSQEDIKQIYEYVLLDNPHIFYVDNVYETTLGATARFVPKYIYSKRAINKLNSMVNTYLSNLKKAFEKTDDMSALGKERFVHDYCLKYFSYDHKLKKISHTILGPIENKKAVCDGISKFVKLALNYMGVQCIVVTGVGRNPSKSKDEPHAWNIVDIDGWSYHLDVTYDMTLTETITRYDYFNLADNDILKDHVCNGIIPKCGIDGSYYLKERLVARSLNELEPIIDRHVQTPGKVCFCVKLSSMAYTENTVNTVMELALRRYQIVNPGKANVNVRYNSTQMVFEISLK